MPNADENDGAQPRRDAGAIGAQIAGLPHVALRLPGVALGAPGAFLLFAVDCGTGSWDRMGVAAAGRHVGRNAVILASVCVIPKGWDRAETDGVEATGGGINSAGKGGWIVFPDKENRDLARGKAAFRGEGGALSQQ